MELQNIIIIAIALAVSAISIRTILQALHIDYSPFLSKYKTLIWIIGTLALVSLVAIYLINHEIITVTGLDSQNIVVEKAKESQQYIDSLAVSIVHPRRDFIQEQITEYNTQGKDTLDLAKKLIPLTTVEFLLADKKDKIAKAVNEYQKEAITFEELEDEIENQKAAAKAVLMEYNLPYK